MVALLKFLPSTLMFDPVVLPPVVAPPVVEPPVVAPPVVEPLDLVVDCFLVSEEDCASKDIGEARTKVAAVMWSRVCVFIQPFIAE